MVKKYKIFKFLFLQIFPAFILATELAKANDNIIFGSDENSIQCRNPNGHWGRCISLYACNAFKNVMLFKSEEAYRFLRSSKCTTDGTATYPQVCCTEDTQFDDAVLEQKIVFPSDDNDGDRDVTVDTIQTHSTTRTPPTTSFVTKPKSIPDLIDEKFPRPPHCGPIILSEKIYGGVEAELREFAWMVNLEYLTAKGHLTSVCAGSLINSRYVLTAAHCIKGAIEEKIGKLASIRLGEHNTATAVDCNAFGCIAPFQRVGIEYYIVHEHFDDAQDMRVHQHNDIALIRLDRPITYTDSIHPICLPLTEEAKQLTNGIKLTVAGWGHNGTAKRTAEKHKVILPVVDHNVCRHKHLSVFYVADEQLCAGGVFKEDSCTGDSGGPLMRLSKFGWFLEGIVSFGHGCGLEKPGIYTNVRHYLPWIERHVRVD